jgi:hypothetical protein
MYILNKSFRAHFSHIFLIGRTTESFFPRRIRTVGFVETLLFSFNELPGWPTRFEKLIDSISSRRQKAKHSQDLPRNDRCFVLLKTYSNLGQNTTAWEKVTTVARFELFE